MQDAYREIIVKLNWTFGAPIIILTKVLLRYIAQESSAFQISGCGKYRFYNCDSDLEPNWTDQIVTLGLFHFIGPTNGYTRKLHIHSASIRLG